MSGSTELTIAVCLFPNLTALDYQGPVELFGFLKKEELSLWGFPSTPKHTLRITYLSHTLDPVPLKAGPDAMPQETYRNIIDNNRQFDIFLVPGGNNARPECVPVDLLEFIKHQAPGAKYILSVCTGSWVLAGTGLLDGRKATTNKAAFRSCKAATSDKIDWIPKARWVVDGNIWTSSGVSAGMDMASGFLDHLVGDEVSKVIRASAEFTAKGKGDDEFAKYYGLVSA